MKQEPQTAMVVEKRPSSAIVWDEAVIVEMPLASRTGSFVAAPPEVTSCNNQTSNTETLGFGPAADSSLTAVASSTTSTIVERKAEPALLSSPAASRTGTCKRLSRSEDSAARKCVERLAINAHSNAMQMTECSQVTEREIYYAVMLDRVRDLVDQRNLRERPFDKLVALILASLDHRTSEEFSLDQVRAIQQVADRLRQPKIDELDLNDCRRFLRQARLDPSRALGGVFGESG